MGGLPAAARGVRACRSSGRVAWSLSAAARQAARGHIGAAVRNQRKDHMATASPQTFRSVDQRLLVAGGNIIRFGLVVVIVWIGALKFTASEATRIQPFIE